MRKFEAFKLVAAVDAVRKHVDDWWVHNHCPKVGVEPKNIAPVDKRRFVKLQSAANSLLAVCREAELTTGLDTVDLFCQRLSYNPDTPPNELVIHGANAIYAVENELKRRWFVELSTTAVKYYELDRPFGDDVYNAFPSARDDVTESATCLAVDRTTASVFHAMRALEVLVRVLAKDLGIKANIYEFDSEQTIIDQIVSRVKDKKANLKANKKNKHVSTNRAAEKKIEAYASLAARLESCKDAWRNKVAHAQKTYDEKKAKRIYDTLGHLLEDAAVFLRER